MDRPLDALPEGTKLAGYVIGRVLGRGGFGITYLAADALYPDVKAAIKELLPAGLAMRQAGEISVHPTSPDRAEPFRRALASFEREALTLKALRHPNVVEVQRYIELNGTAYVVMKYEEGRSLATILAGDKTLSPAEIMDILPPLLDGLEAVHAKRFVHRDLKPGNIYLRSADGSPVLLDFGAAREAIGEERKTSLSEIYTPGYAPLEQYDRHAEQGPFTDIYALGATLYRCMTGETPPEAITRHNALRRGAADPLPAAENAAKGRYPPALLEAVRRSLALEERERPQSIAELRALIGFRAEARSVSLGPAKTLVGGIAAPPAARAPAFVLQPGPHGAATPPALARRRAWAVAGGLVLLAGAAAAYMAIPSTKSPDGERRAPQQPSSGPRMMADAERQRLEEERVALESQRRAAEAEAKRRAEQEAARQRDEDRRRAAEAERKRIEAEVKRLVGEAERAIKTEDWAAAERALAEAKRLKPDHAEVAALEAKLKSAKEAASRLVPGRVFRDCPDCPEMLVIPAGTFTMGSPADEKVRNADEGPQHRVTIAKPFALGKYEVTFAEWDVCTAAGGCTHRPGDQGWGRGRRPVINVSWDDAKAYVAWLSRKTGKIYRLPSEAEWEYAARAGTTTPFSTGETISTDQANYDGNYIYGNGQKGVYRRQTAPVGSFAANRFGLHDMHGNVWEWVEDCWNGSYSSAPGDGRARLTGECSRRVLRGGSWISDPGNLRSARRGGYASWDGFYFNGFRVARTLD